MMITVDRMRMRVRLVIGFVSYCISYGLQRECIGYALASADAIRPEQTQREDTEERSRIVEFSPAETQSETQSGDDVEVEVVNAAGDEWSHREHGIDDIHFDEFELEPE